MGTGMGFRIGLKCLVLAVGREALVTSCSP